MPLVCLSTVTCPTRLYSSGLESYSACTCLGMFCWSTSQRPYWSRRGKAPSGIWNRSFFTLLSPACELQLFSQQSHSCMKPPAGNNNNISSFQGSVTFLERLFDNTVKTASRLQNPITHLFPEQPGDNGDPCGEFRVLQTFSNAAGLHQEPDGSDRRQFGTECALITSCTSIHMLSGPIMVEQGWW